MFAAGYFAASAADDVDRLDHWSRTHLERLCSEHGTSVGALEGLRGHRLPLRRKGAPLASERAASLGDDPLGETFLHAGKLVEKMRADNAIYMVGDSRMNIAGLNEKTVPILAKAIIDAGV